MHNTAPNIPDLVTVDGLAQRMPAVPVATLRDLIYHAEERFTAAGEKIPPNGFAKCIVRLGSRIYIDVPVFVEWLESKRAAPLDSARMAA